jgi:hypothetical protein
MGCSYMMLLVPLWVILVEQVFLFNQMVNTIIIIRMLDSDWLLTVIFFLQIQALHCEFAEFLHHAGVFA